LLTSNQILARLERIPVSRWHVRARMIVGAATLFDGIDTLAIAYVLPVLVATWHLTHSQAALLISAGYAGQLIGGIVSGWLAERIGRRPTIVITVATYALLSFFCAFSWSYSSLLIFRILQGLGLGGEVPVAATYVNELARAKGRGRFFLLYEQAYSAGRLAAALLGVWVVGHFGWRYMFLIGGLPAFLTGLLMRGLPESPRWLVSKGRLIDADQVVSGIENQQSGDLPNSYETVAVVTSERSDWRELFRGVYRVRTFTSWILWFTTFLLLNGLANWVPTLYTTTFRLPLQTALRYGAISSVTGFAGCLSVALLIEYVGRRLWYAGAFCSAAVACLVLWYHGASSPTEMLILTSVTAFFINSIAMVVFLHTPEIYPTRIRALATSLASSWLRVASIVAPLFIGVTLSGGSLADVFLVFGIAAGIAALVSWRFVVETSNRTLEEIAP
jgi:putative MFS transporter